MKPIYVPKGKAKEYGDYALNIYTGCPHGCTYCFAPGVLRKDRETFHCDVKPRENIVEETKKQLASGEYAGKTIHLCFTCDPYPKDCDSSVTREIISILKQAGCHIQILTKNGTDALRDFDLLDREDWFGITYAGYNHCMTVPEEEPNADKPFSRIVALAAAHNFGIKTWVSFEPVLNAEDALYIIGVTSFADLRKIGKLNYHPSDVNWAEFGNYAEALCKSNNLDYYIKDSLREIMDKENTRYEKE